MKIDVTSARNERAKLLKRLVRDAGERRRAGLCVVEGPRVVRELLATRLELAFAFVSPRLEQLDPDGGLLAALRARLPPEALVTANDDVLESVSDTRAPQGVVVAAARPDGTQWPDGAPLLIAWEIQDPGNVGALTRTAEAAACSGLVVARSAEGQAADPFSPRSLRAAAGSAFRLPVHEWMGEPAALVESLQARGLRAIACVAEGGSAPEDVALTGRVALLVGAETRGLPEALVTGATLVTIPLAGPVESLNAAAAAAVIAFEAARQRRTG